MAGLGVARVLSLDLDGRSETSLDPDLRVFLSDLVRPHGLALREDLLGQGVGHAFGEMGEVLLRAALAPDEPVDLLVVAFDMPDVQPGRANAVYLSRFCPGAPLAFAVCDQGTSAAFTALRIAADCARTGDVRRAVVLVMEQTALHYVPDRPVTLPRRNRAVALVCEWSEDGGMTVRQSSGSDLGPDQGAELVRIGRKALGPDTAVILGADLPPGQPLTGVWTELADRLPGWRAEHRPVLVADLDRRHGRLSTLALPALP
ncbi:hypothetical protein ACEZDE_23870 [Streptacidiphilus sp. N8-3]|uniref:2-hydroxy-acid oxidase n=1 Tax=Streptacidiphilus cavernicola TaxID=3342716 RepID=A0ABV6W156_9ACTN